MLLPDDLFWSILRNSTRNDNTVLPEDSGKLISYEFWPKWDPRNTSNTNYVEPDVFFRFENIDVIIEAKYGDESGQYYDEWEREVIAYANVYKKEKKKVVLLAVGGNSDFKEVQPINYDGIICCVFKYRWCDLLEHLLKIEKEITSTQKVDEQQNQLRLIKLIKDGFKIMGVTEYKQKIDYKSVSHISTIFKLYEDSCNRNTPYFQLSKYDKLITTERFLYRFHVESNNKTKKELWLGLGLWFDTSNIYIEIDPDDNWAKALIDDDIMNKIKNHSPKYLTEIYDENGKNYIDATEKFYDDFSKSQSYDEQLSILNSFVDELLSLYNN